MKFKMLMAVILASLTLATVSYRGQGLDRSSRLLNREVKGANLENVMVGQAALNALLNTDTPGGVATVSDCRATVTHSFTPRDSSLRGILDSIVATEPRYTWELKEGVINVIPRTGLPRFFGVRVVKFDAVDAESPRDVLFQLLALPELRETQLSLGRHAVQGGAYVFCPDCPPKETKKFSVRLKGVTMREALNTIARAHGNAVWSFSQSDCGGQKIFSIDFAAK